MNNNIVILAIESNRSKVLINDLQKKYSLKAVVYEKPISRRTLLRKKIKKLGLLNVIGQALFTITIPSILKRFSKNRIQEILVENGLDNSPIKEEKVIRVTSANSDQCIQILQSLQPDLVILCGTRIISKRVLKSVNAVFINIHAGITPLYRGVHGAYWALIENNLSLCGVTLHYVDEGIDTGKVIAQELIAPTAKDNFITYAYLQLAAGIVLLREQLPGILSGDVQEFEPLTNRSSLRYHPTLFVYIKNFIIKGIK
jgi:folate-dependent phosphoribosylglycinamide formyltransferase PurN